MSFDGEKSERVMKRERKKVWCSGIICAKPCGVTLLKAKMKINLAPKERRTEY